MKDPIGYSLLVLALGLLALIALVTLALAHSWYDPARCAETDCAPIPQDSVVAEAEGWRVTLRPEDHFRVTTFVEELVPYGRARVAQDGGFHACVHPQGPVHEGQSLICLYAPVMGF